MKLNRMILSHFRNIDAMELAFSDGINMIYGDNAQGKTNMLEAMYLFARGKSFRAKRDAEMIQFEKEGASAEIFFDSRRGIQKMRAAYLRPDQRKRTVNGVPIRRVSEFIGNFRAVLFYPDHLSIVKASPSERRAFIDIALSQLRPAHVAFSQQYRELLQQRNALLRDFDKRDKGKMLTLSVLSGQLSECAAYITLFRAEYVEKLRGRISTYFDEMTGGKEKTELCYISDIAVYKGTAEKKKAQGENADMPLDVSIPCEGIPLETVAAQRKLKSVSELREQYEALFAASVEKEAERGATLYGPHKDDLEILLSGKKARLFASQGQQRSLTLALKLAEGDISKEESGEYPVFLFDDVLSELDENRKKYLLSQLHGRQVIITACSEDLFSGYELAQKIKIQNGKLL